MDDHGALMHGHMSYVFWMNKQTTVAHVAEEVKDGSDWKLWLYAIYCSYMAVLAAN